MNTLSEVNRLTNKFKKGKIRSNQQRKYTVVTITIVITLIVNKITCSIKRHRLKDCIKKRSPTVSCTQKTHLIKKVIHRVKIKAWKTIFHAPGA